MRAIRLGSGFADISGALELALHGCWDLGIVAFRWHLLARVALRSTGAICPGRAGSTRCASGTCSAAWVVAARADVETSLVRLRAESTGGWFLAAIGERGAARWALRWALAGFAAHDRAAVAVAQRLAIGA